MKTFSFFEIDSSASDKLIESLNGTKFNRVNVKVEVSREAPISKKSKSKNSFYKKDRPKKNRWRRAGSQKRIRRKKN